MGGWEGRPTLWPSLTEGTLGERLRRPRLSVVSCDGHSDSTEVASLLLPLVMLLVSIRSAPHADVCAASCNG